MVVTRSQSAWSTPAGWSTYTHIRSRPVSSTASTSTPGMVDSTRWAISRSSCFSFACVSAIGLSSKKTGAARPFLRSGEMWCEKDSKRLRAGELREAEQGDAEDDERCAGQPRGTDPLAEDRRSQDDGDDDARLPHRRHRRGGREPQSREDALVRAEGRRRASEPRQPQLAPHGC